MRIGGGKGDEQIAGTVAGDASGSGETERGAAGQTF